MASWIGPGKDSCERIRRCRHERTEKTMSWFSAEHLQQLISTYGYGAVGAIVAMESIGLPAPGEIILIVCAVYANTHHDLNIWGVIAVAAAGAILGDKTLAIQPLRPDGLPAATRLAHATARKRSRADSTQWAPHTRAGFVLGYDTPACYSARSRHGSRTRLHAQAPSGQSRASMRRRTAHSKPGQSRRTG